MKAAFIAASLFAAVGVYAQHPSQQPWTDCMLNCMNGAVSSAVCGDTWNKTECLCLSDAWVNSARSCMYSPCVNDVYPFYNIREAECGTLTRDLDNAAFIASNGNSTWDEANPNGNQTISSIIASRSSAASGSSAGGARPTGSTTGSAGPARSSNASPTASSTGSAPSNSATGAAASSPTSGAGQVAPLGLKEGAVAIIAAFGVVAGSALVL